MPSEKNLNQQTQKVRFDLSSPFCLFSKKYWTCPYPWCISDIRLWAIQASNVVRPQVLEKQKEDGKRHLCVKS